MGVDPDTPDTDARAVGSALARVGRKAGIAAAGGVVTTAGVIMLVTPGPGIVTILLGLGLLGREFPKVRILTARLKSFALSPRSRRDVP